AGYLVVARARAVGGVLHTNHFSAGRSQRPACRIRPAGWHRLGGLAGGGPGMSAWVELHLFGPLRRDAGAATVCARDVTKAEGQTLKCRTLAFSLLPLAFQKLHKLRLNKQSSSVILLVRI